MASLEELLARAPRNGDDPLLTASAAAKRIGVCAATVRRWIAGGLVETEPRGPKRKLVRLSSIDRFEAPRPARRLHTVAPLPPVSGVYFIRGGGAVKIGKSDDVEVRLSTLRLSSPVHLELCGVVPALPGVSLEIEKRLHERFAAHRTHGEWFTDCAEIQAYIAEHSVALEAAR